ncbi:hypothetical protein BK750_20215 [Bacillus thuringiensis serovar jegathesan]|uniref:DUF4306 domain-containing protein n=1 Tax=Bacillus thuringiensis subsp. jegathesan TaxID=56955 RepID=A0A9X6M2I0_BACTJ|nr:hypothetical protein BK750_20215 [Bacillus thuringiensis serovar jegathesan]
MVQLIFSFCVFLISTLFTWYEGSGIMDRVDLWESTAIFTKLFSGIDVVYNEFDISQLDYFVYAARIHSTSFIVMVLSFLYFLGIIFYYFLQKRKK